MSKKKATALSLPINRTAKIMTSAVGVESVNQDIVALATKATEIFLTDFARGAYDRAKSNVLDYDDITDLVHSDSRYDFLVDTTPKRIKFGEALRLIDEAKKHEAEREAEREAHIKSLSKPPKEKQETKEEAEPEEKIDRTLDHDEAQIKAETTEGEG